MTGPSTRSWPRRAAGSLLSLLARGWRHAAIGRSRDGSSLLDGRRLMVLAPHPDDETFGCGATIARSAAAGSPVTVVVATDGRHCTPSSRLTPAEIATLRDGELRAACRRLGVGDVVQLGYEDGTLGRHRATVTAQLEQLLLRRRPEVVLLPCLQDSHPDHRALHVAARQAVAATLPGCLMLAYPVWSWYEAPWFLSSPWRRRPRLFLWALGRALAGFRYVPAGPYLAAKQTAQDAYVSQTTNLTGEASWSYLDARFRAAFLHPAEVFLPVPPTDRPPARQRSAA